MGKIEDVMMQLLRSVMNGVGADGNAISDVDWVNMLTVARNQGVDAIVMDAIGKLPEDHRPGIQQLLPLIGSAVCKEHRYATYADAISEMGRIMESKELTMLILKGYGCSLNYPIPSHRPCGDIDIYVMDRYGNHNSDIVEYVNNLMCYNGGVPISFDNGHHSVFKYKQFVVENHRTIIDVNTHSSSARLNILLEALAHDCWMHSKNKCGLLLPDVAFNSIYLLRHMANDFATVNMTLRQLLDWASFVERNNDKMKWSFVYSLAHQFNMHIFLNSINCICVDYLGYSVDYFFIEKRNDYWRDKVLSEIFCPAFQKEIPPMKNWLKYCLIKTQRMWMNRWKYNIVYDDSLLSTFFFHANNRIRDFM